MINFSTVKNITIPEGEVAKITLDGITLWQKDKWDVTILPLDGSELGSLPVTQVYVNAGDIVTIQYYLTKRQGYIYDARNINQNYYGSVSSSKYPMATSEVGQICEKTLTIAKTGYIMISGYYARTSDIGKISSTATDSCYGYYMKVKIN